MTKDISRKPHQNVPCIAPWVHFHGQMANYGPCCDILFGVGKEELFEGLLDKTAFLELFNSDQYRKLRKRLVDGDLPHACKVCIACGYHRPYDQEVFGRDFEEIVKEEFVVPSSVSLTVDSPCNIRCVFCKSARDYRDPDKDFETFSHLFDRIEEIGWENMTSVRIGGGEPFFNPGFNRFLQAYDWTRLGETPLNIITNATLLHKNIKSLAHVKRVDFVLSVDAVGEVYEWLRRGAKWDRVKANLELLSDYMRERPGWTATIHSIVMKSTLPYMSEMIELSHRLGFDSSVMNIHGKYFEENIFLFPDILKGMDWEGHFKNAIDKADKYDFAFAGKELRRLRSYLRDKVNGIHKPIRGFANDEDSLAYLLDFFASLKGRSYGVLGVDDKIIEVTQTDDKLEGLQFVADNGGNILDFMGYPFVNADSLADEGETLTKWRGEIDLLVISCSSWEYNSYLKTAKKLFPDTEIALVPIYDSATRANLERIASSGEPLVGFCTGGAANMLLDGTPLGKAGFVAFADNNSELHGTNFHGKPIIPLEKITEYANNVVILSQGFAKDISRQIKDHHGEDVVIKPLFE